MDYSVAIGVPNSKLRSRSKNKKLKRLFENKETGTISGAFLIYNYLNPINSLRAGILYSKILKASLVELHDTNDPTDKNSLLCSKVNLGDEILIDKKDILKCALESEPESNLRIGCVCYYKSDDEVFYEILEDEKDLLTSGTRFAISLHPNASEKILNYIYENHPEYWDVIVRNFNCPTNLLEKIFERTSCKDNQRPTIIRRCLIHPNAPYRLFEMAINSSIYDYRMNCVRSPNVPLEILFEALGDEDDWIAEVALNKIKERRGDII